jgi:hypothetical protein
MNKIEEIPKTITLKIDTFEKEAQNLGIYNFNEFYESEAFKAKHKIDEKKILCHL